MRDAPLAAVRAFQLVVTPSTRCCAAAVLASRATALPLHQRLVPAQSLGRALDLRHPPPGDRRREYPVRRRRAAAHRDVEAQLDVGDAGAPHLLPAARVRGQEGIAVAAVLRLGVRARLADHHRPQRRHRRDAADGRRRAASASARASGSSSIRRARGSRPARAPSTRPAARASRSRSACRSCRSRTTPATSGPRACFGKRPGTVTISFGQPITPDGKDGAGADRRSRSVDRSRSRAPRSSRERPVTARAHCPRDEADRLGALTLAGQDVDYRLIRARRRSIGMQIGLAGLTVRASRWVTSAKSRPRSPNAPPGSCARSPRGAAAAATSCRANGRAARRSSTAAASSRSRCTRPGPGRSPPTCSI